MSKQIVRNAPKRVKPEQTVIRDVCHDMRYVLILDCETTMDFSQALRLAGYCIYDTEKQAIREEGFLYDVLSEGELQTLKAYTLQHGLKLWSRFDFIEKRFYPLLLNGACYANHNIKFDIGTLAISWFYTDKDTIAMVLCHCLDITGYDGTATECEKHPAIAVQHLPSGKYLFSIRSSSRVGTIVDTMQLGKALLGASIPGSLIEMGKKFRCQKVKFISDSHGVELTEEYIRYTQNDVEATLELFLKQIEEYKRHNIPKPLASLVSEASIGKGYLAKAEIIPFYQRHINVPEWYEKIAAITYKGARSEVMHRLQPIEIAYLDFMSQYPLVNALLDLQSILLASSVSVLHVTHKIRMFLQDFSIEQLQDKATWKKLRVFVKIKPEGDMLMIETREEGDAYPVTRNTYVYGTENWYTLCDVIGSIIRTGKKPHIIDAIEMIPYGRIPTKPIQFYGNAQFTIDMNHQDLFASLIDLRSSVKREWAKYSREDENYGYYESLQNGMKLVANSTSYGALAESRELKGVDIAGKYSAYALASHITAGGRLLLAIAEALGSRYSLKYVMCDTDSMAFAKPSEMERSEFMRHIETICTWFSPLSPFKSSQDIFELEAVNGNRPLYFVGISSKRYAVFHILEDGSIAIRKATVNGVGSVLCDRYENYDGSVNFPWPEDIPNPKKDTRYALAKGVKPLYEYQYLMWYRAIQQVIQGKTDIKIPVEEWSNMIVRFSVGINTPYLLKIHSYITGIRPFSFLLKLPNGQYLSGVNTSQEIEKACIYKTGTQKQTSIAHFTRLHQYFSDYFTHPEAKVKDGTARGWLQKIAVHPTEVRITSRKGKESLQQDTIFSLLGED